MNSELVGKLERRKYMNKAILLKADDWEGLFVNGELVEEGHTLNEGASRIKYFLDLADEYLFNLRDMKEIWVTEEDEEIINKTGGFPVYLNQMQENYESIHDLNGSD